MSMRGSWVERIYTPAGSERAPAPYRAFVPAPIATLEPELGPASIGALVEAESALRAWSEHLGGRAEPERAILRSLFARLEAVSSSTFEGVSAASGALSFAMAHPNRVREENLLFILGNLAALERAARAGARATTFGVSDLTDCHRDLMNGVRPFGGQVRDEAVWIGGAFSTPLNADYVPPPPECLSGALEDLAAFVRRTDLPSVWQGLVAHAQFETIHPFADGNGRCGRALFALVFAAGGLSMPPLSARFLARRREYIAALEAFRADDLEGCVLAICDALLDAITIAVRAEEAYDRAQAELRAAAGARRDSAAARALAYLAVAPLTEVRALADSLSVSFGAASGAVRALAEAGLLVPENDNLRGRRWRCPRGEKLLREIGA